MANKIGAARAERRHTIIDSLVDHLLRHGLAKANLRAFAAAAGTSDRMLLYYFTDKDDLIAAVLERAAERAGTMFDAIGTEQRPFAVLLTDLWTLTRGPALRPYQRLWFQMAATAMHGEEPHRTVAGLIGRSFLEWTSARLTVDRPEEREAQAALLVATMDGLTLLDAIGLEDAAKLALTSPA